MVVRITGDADAYEDMLEAAVEETQETADEVEKQASRIEGIASSVKGFFASAIGAITGFGAKEMLEDFLGAFSEAEEVDIQLGAALKANKRDVDALMESYQEFATSIQRQTTMGDESVKMILKQAESFGLTGKAAEKATKDAIALAEATGGSAMAMMRLTAALTRGDVDTAKRFARMVPQLRGIKDNAEFVKKATDLMSAGWETATEKADTASGRLKQLDEVIGDIKEELGKTVADVIKPFIESLRDVALWVGELPSAVKEGIVVALGLAVAIGVVTAAIIAATAAATLFDISTGGMLLILGAIVTGIAVATGAIVSFASATGGFAALATKARDALREFWEWLKPVRQALVSLGGAVEEVFNQVVESIKEAIVDIWSSIQSGVDWNQIRDQAVVAILSIEFYLRNFKRTWDVVWFGAKLGFLILKEELAHFFQVQVPIFLGNFSIGLRNVASDMVHNWKVATKNLIDNLIMIKKGWRLLLTEQVTFDDLWKPLTEGFRNNLREGMIDIPGRIVGPVENMMRKMFGQMWDNLDADRKKFIQEKLREFGLVPEAEKAAEDAGEKTGQEYNKGLDKEIKKVDAALFNSAEALSRLADHRERTGRRVTDVSPQKPGAAFGDRMTAAIKQQLDLKKSMEDAVRNGFPPVAIKALLSIEQSTKKQADNMGFPLQPSSLNE